MRFMTWTTCGGLLALALSGCDSASTDATAGETTLAAADEADASAEERMFDREALRGDGCALLSAGDVAEAAGIAVAEVTEETQVDCYFSWGEWVVYASSIKAHRSIKRARNHYASFTEDVTAEEMQQGKDELRAQLDTKAAAGEISDAAASAGGALAGAMPDEAVSNRALPGIGNEASYNGRSVMVRVGNVTFNVEARRDYDYDPELSRTLAQQMVSNLEQL